MGEALWLWIRKPVLFSIKWRKQAVRCSLHATTG